MFIVGIVGSHSLLRFSFVVRFVLLLRFRLRALSEISVYKFLFSPSIWSEDV